jgi:hypothetical protein
MAEKIGEWAQDILTRIYNVNWGGLAVIFGARDEDCPSQLPQGGRAVSDRVSSDVE